MKGETMQPEGQHERFYGLTAERSPSPWRYVPEDEATDAYNFTFGRWFPDQEEFAAMMQAGEACDRCPHRGTCDSAYSENTVDCYVARRLT